MTDNEFLLEDRLQKIRQIIGKYGEDKFYISFSGGKDSTVLHYLIDEALPDNQIPRVYFNTGIEFQMIVDYVKAFVEKDKRFEIIKPRTPIKKMLEEEGYPFKSKEHSQRVHEYQNNYRHSNTTYNYMMCEGSYAHRPKYACPISLRVQFFEDYPLKISKSCCDRLKKDISKKYMQDHNISWSITGMTRAEGGARTRIECVNYEKGVGKFHPLAPISKEWIDWYIERKKIHLCQLYYPPFNFERTGCKGCPYNIKLQEELDILREYLPNEAKQCEYIWQPVYEEYRRLGYRLRQPDRYKQIPGQMSIEEYFGKE